MRKTGPLSYIVNVNGIERRKHADQLRKRMAESDVESEEAEVTHSKTSAEPEPQNLMHPHIPQPVFTQGSKTWTLFPNLHPLCRTLQSDNKAIFSKMQYTYHNRIS